MRKINMYIRSLLTVAVIALTALPAIARDQINIVGSSTVFPFSTTVAERFGKSTAFKTPVVESTGSGGGMKLFCTGVGESTPDITNASRRIKSSEAEKCVANGVTPIEAKIGFDGIVLANSRESGRMEVTRQQIFLRRGARDRRGWARRRFLDVDVGGSRYCNQVLYLLIGCHVSRFG